MCDDPTVFRRVTRRARKEHRCCEGEHRIMPGDEYSYVSGVWDGRGESFKQCLTCAELFEGVSDNRPYEWECGPAFGLLGDYVEEVIWRDGIKLEWEELE